MVSFISGDVLENSKYTQQRDMCSSPPQKGVVSLLQAEFLQNLQTVKGLTATI